MLNAALMRRFVRYHKLAVTFGDDELDLGVRMIANELHGSSTDENVIAVAQAITRIEDAEMLLRRADEAAKANAEVVASTDSPYPEACALRDFYGFDAKILFAMADVDPVKWAATAATSGAILEGVACTGPKGGNS